ncbi:hypothetical protein FSE01_15260 [Salmonella enterica subsp. enterica]|nr:hypothetical protein [Salmonella enterica subsp. enterica serovar Veneziana]
MNKVLISGVLREPDGTIIPGAKIEFTQQANSASSFAQRTVEVITSGDGTYEVQIFPGKYLVSMATRNTSRNNLGLIVVTNESGSGTLNDFLITSSSATNPVMEQMQRFYFAALALSQSPAKVVNTVTDIPDDASGFVLVTDDESKNSPALYLYVHGRRYWFAMVEDAAE